MPIAPKRSISLFVNALSFSVPTDFFLAFAVSPGTSPERFRFELRNYFSEENNLEPCAITISPISKFQKTKNLS
jgi:hypothetical protein